MTEPTRDDELRQFVSSRITHLYASSRNGGTSAGVISALRKRSTPGSNPDTWEATLGLPARLAGTGAAASRYELAAHTALTLWAAHQQSKSENMHNPKRRFGAAVKLLTAAPGKSEQAVMRRFRALATARTVEGFMVHARGLVTQMRDAGISFDYVSLAVDISRLQTAAGRSQVALTWGRDLHAPARPTASTHEDKETAA